MQLKGEKFGRLFVLGPIKKSPGRQRGFCYSWLCRCDCGVELYVKQEYLTSGGTRSCGCLRRDMMAKRQKTHGLSHTRTYHTWQSIKQRCLDINHPAYKYYGKRGITMCKQWQDSFENFFADMGLCPDDNHSIERIDNDKGYFPENCRWATAKVQARNTRRNHILDYDGKSLSIVEWSEVTGLKQTTIRMRLKYGWSVEETLTTPVMRRHS